MDGCRVGHPVTSCGGVSGESMLTVRTYSGGSLVSFWCEQDTDAYVGEIFLEL